MKNYMQIELGGKLRGLKFNLGTLNFIQEITGIDPFEYRAAGSKYSELIPVVTNIIHAAILSNCSIKKEEPDFTEEDVKGWVKEIENIGVLTDIINMYNAIMVVPKQKADGEVGGDTQTNL